MSELREECYECLNNQSCIPGADYGSIYCSMYRKHKMPEHREDRAYAHKFSVMQQQLEQKDKRIQELERKYLHEKLAKEEVEELLENRIPTQRVENKLEELKKNYDEKYDLYMGYKVESREQQDILKQMSILQELLGGGK